MVPPAVNRHFAVGSQNHSDLSPMSGVAKELAKYLFCFLLILTEVYLFSLKPGVEVLSFSELCRDCKIQQTLPAGTSGEEESSRLDQGQSPQSGSPPWDVRYR